MSRVAHNKIHDEYSHLNKSTAYYYRNKGKAKEYELRKKLENPEEFNRKNRERYANRVTNGWSRKGQWPRQRLITDLLQNARHRAKNQNVPFDLTEKDLIIPSLCPITGLKLERHKGQSQESSFSVDKVIPKLGYVKGNTRVISKKANRWKQDMLREDVQKLLDYIDGKI